MKKYFSVFLGFCIWIICLGGCERDRGIDTIDIYIKNSWNDSLFGVFQFNYPDTSLLNYSTQPELYTVVAPQTENKVTALLGWEKTIKGKNAHSILTVIIYSSDTLNKYPFSQIQQDYNILKRYDLSIEQLRALNWTITYP